MGCCSFARMLMVDRSRPQKIRLLSSPIRYCLFNPDKNKNLIKQKEIHSSSLLDVFIKTTRRMNRFYKRTFSESVPSSLLVWPTQFETDQAVHFRIPMGDIRDEDVKVSVEKNKTVTVVGEGDGVFEAICGFKKYVSYIDLPDIDSPVKLYTTRGVKAEWSAASLELIIPKLKQHETQDADDDNKMNTFNLNINRIFYEDYHVVSDDDNDSEDCHCNCNKGSLSSFYAYMGSLIQVVRLPPIIKKSSQRFISTISDGNRHRLNLVIHSISNFIYADIINRFGLFSQRAYTIASKQIKQSSQETDEFLYYYLQLNEVVSHEKVRVTVDFNKLEIQGVVYDEFKATHHKYTKYITLQPEDSFLLMYNMRDIKADFSQGEGGGELKLSIPKFDATQRMMNDSKNEAGEFLKLKDDAFMFDIKVNG